MFCNGGAEALSAAVKRPPDILFSDLRMPIMNGLAFLSEFSMRHPRATRFAITGQLAPNELVELETLAEQVFSKPIDCGHIQDIITGLMRSPQQTTFRASSFDEGNLVDSSDKLRIRGINTLHFLHDPTLDKYILQPSPYHNPRQ